MQCKWNTCTNEARNKSPFCSGTCKKRFQRSSGTNVSVGASGTVKLHIITEGEVYGRQAVKCSQYGTRPMPLVNTDQPHPGGRGKYTRQDGTTYQFDSSGTAHDDQPASDSPTPTQLQAARDRRTNPDRLNWGKRMTFSELNKAGLKGNRVAIPGDWDYVKVAQ